MTKQMTDEEYAGIRLDEELEREMRVVMPSLSAKVAAMARIRHLREENEQLKLKIIEFIETLAKIESKWKEDEKKYERALESLSRLVVEIHRVRKDIGTKFPRVAEAWVLARALLAEDDK